MTLNLPNRLTLGRALSVPLVVLFVWLGGLWRLIGLGLFAAAGITDFCDGKIARSRGLVTDFGKFLDPVADKLLVICTMVTLCRLGEMSLCLCIVVIIRELCVDGLRMIAATQGHVIAAAKLGKLKTTVQMVLLLWVLILGGGPIHSLLGEGLASFYEGIAAALSVLAGLLTLFSGAEYFVKNKNVLRT